MIIRLSLVCHASTSGLRTAAFPLDEGLDQFGTADAAAAAAPGTWSAEHCWCGPELRTRQTAAALGLTATPDAGLSDCDYGRWRGSTLAEIQAKEPEAIRAWIGDPAAAPHGGESLLDLLARVGGWMDRLHAGPGRTGSTRIIAFSHPAVIRAAIVHALCAGASSFWRIDVGPLSQALIVGHAGRWTLRAINPARKKSREGGPCLEMRRSALSPGPFGPA